MKNRHYLSILIFLLSISYSFSQNTTLTPHGVVFPQMTTIQINALTGQAKGTMVFDNILNQMKYWDGTTWQSVTNGSSSGAWQSSGNDQYSTNSGNVGIGISTPAAKLSVNGNLGLYDSGVEYGFLSKNITNGALRLNGGLSFNAITTPKNLGLQVNIVNGLGSTFVAGNVGIGTDQPEEKFTTLTSSNKYGMLHSNGAVKIGTYIGGNAGWLGTKSNHPLILHTNNGANQHYFRENGRVGLGIEFPEQKLHINGSFKTEAGIYAAQTGNLNLVPIGIAKYEVSLNEDGVDSQEISNISGSLVSSLTTQIIITSVDDTVVLSFSYDNTQTQGYSDIIPLGATNILDYFGAIYGSKVYDVSLNGFKVVHNVDDLSDFSDSTTLSGYLIFYGIKNSNLD
ncbi:hypothetical protein [Lacihabitans soyangensis]|nr:hypothetical protein [Lacihabitans soyangensis]